MDMNNYHKLPPLKIIIVLLLTIAISTLEANTGEFQYRFNMDGKSPLPQKPNVRDNRDTSQTNHNDQHKDKSDNSGHIQEQIDHFLCPPNGFTPTNYSGILRGVILFDDNDLIYLVVYNRHKKEHLVYQSPAKWSVRPFEGKFIAKGLKPSRMKDLWGYDPEANLRYIVGLNDIVYIDTNTNETVSSRALLLSYANRMDILMIDSGKVYRNLMTTSNVSLGIVFTPDAKGMHFYYDSEKRQRVIASDLVFVSGNFWDVPNQYYMIESKKSQDKLFMKKSGPYKDQRFVNWTMVVGFVFDGSFVHLFTDSFVYIFVDNYDGKHDFMEFNYKGMKIPYREYFHCDGELQLAKLEIVQGQAKHENRKMLIFILMGMHLLVATILFIMIAVVSFSGKTTTGQNQNELSRFRSKSKGSIQSSSGSGRSNTSMQTGSKSPTSSSGPLGKCHISRHRRPISSSMLSNEQLPKFSGFEPRKRPSMLSLNKIPSLLPSTKAHG